MRFKKKKEKHRSAVTLSDNGTLSDYVDGGGGVDEGETKDQKENGSRGNLHGEFKCV